MVKYVPRVHFVSHRIKCTRCPTELCLKCFPLELKKGKYISEIFGHVEESTVNNLGFYNLECLKCKYTKKQRVYFCCEQVGDCKDHKLGSTAAEYERHRM